MLSSSAGFGTLSAEAMAENSPPRIVKVGTALYAGIAYVTGYVLDDDDDTEGWSVFIGGDISGIATWGRTANSGSEPLIPTRMVKDKFQHRIRTVGSRTPCISNSKSRWVCVCLSNAAAKRCGLISSPRFGTSVRT